MATGRSGKFALLAILSLLPSLVFIAQGIRDIRVTDAEIEAGAPEDILGLGFWSLAGPVGIVAVALLLALWHRANGVVSRRIAVGAIVLFVGAIGFEFWSYRVLAARVLR